MKKRDCIMAIDDEAEVLRLLKRIFEEEGYSFVGADSGYAAFNLLQDHRPDLILLDIIMPGLDGFQVLELIRRTSDVPVIILTGKNEMTVLRDTVEIGADDYVKKPFYRLELVARVRAKLRRAARSQPVFNPGKEIIHDKVGN
jgi:DNA-binding response OmpR family regulator